MVEELRTHLKLNPCCGPSKKRNMNINLLLKVQDIRNKVLNSNKKVFSAYLTPFIGILDAREHRCKDGQLNG